MVFTGSVSSLLKGAYNETYLNRLDNLLYWCETYHIYAILDFHQYRWSSYFTYIGGIGFPEWLISEGAYPNSENGVKQCATDFFLNQGYGKTMRRKYINLWELIMNRYKDNPYIWAYEPINEPLVVKGISHSSELADAVMDFYENEFMTIIRQLDSSTIIIYHHLAGNMEKARKALHKNIVWSRSWYDVAYGGYFPSTEYSELESRLRKIKYMYNEQCGTPFIVSEMGFQVGTGNAEQWIIDTFDVMRSIGLNNGFECWNWWIYNKGQKYGYQTPRNSDGSDAWIIPLLQQYLGSDY